MAFGSARSGLSGGGGRVSYTSERDLEAALLGEPGERRLVDDAAPRRIDEDRIGLHQSEAARIQHAARLLIQGSVDADDVAGAHELVEFDALHFGWEGLVQARRIGLHLDFPRRKARCDGTRHMAESDHADCLAAQHAGGLALRSRQVAAERLFLLVQIIERGEHQHDRRLGRAEIILRNPAIADENAELARPIEVEPVDADPRRNDGAELRSARHQSAGAGEAAVGEEEIGRRQRIGCCDKILDAAIAFDLDGTCAQPRFDDAKTRSVARVPTMTTRSDIGSYPASFDTITERGAPRFRR
jgi:hypothetical protein